MKVLLIGVIIALTMVSCEPKSQETEPSIIGKWECCDITIEFTDSNCVYKGIEYEYEVNDGVLIHDEYFSHLDIRIDTNLFIGTRMFDKNEQYCRYKFIRK